MRDDMKTESDNHKSKCRENEKNLQNRRVAKVTCLRHKRRSERRYMFCTRIAAVIFTMSVIAIVIVMWCRHKDNERTLQTQNEMSKEISEIRANETKKLYELPVAGIERVFRDILRNAEKLSAPAEILPEYQPLYEQNPDMIGWLKIEDTVIDYPVMQTMEDEDYYLDYDFNREPNNNGCLIMDTDSTVGTDPKDNEYYNGSKPSTNLIIHGHTMKSGLMFGGLKQYTDETYGKNHSIICFDSLYEQREYQLIAVFYSQVFNNTDKVFKYYNFFQADTQEEFDDWYENIKAMSLYDTGVTAEYGDEFITLSCCSYQVEGGRFVVVGKRIV